MHDALRDAFIRDVADAVRHWEVQGRAELSDGQDCERILADSLRGLAHSILVALDGGTTMSNEGRVVWLKDADGQVVAEGLHQRLPDALDA
jgi:hypothetical protein